MILCRPTHLFFCILCVFCVLCILDTNTSLKYCTAAAGAAVHWFWGVERNFKVAKISGASGMVATHSFATDLNFTPSEEKMFSVYHIQIRVKLSLRKRDILWIHCSTSKNWNVFKSIYFYFRIQNLNSLWEKCQEMTI